MKYKVVDALNTLYWVETFDTRQGEFLPKKAVVPSCGWARLLPSQKERQVQVVCEESKEVRLLRIDSNGSAAASASQFASETNAAPYRNTVNRVEPGNPNTLAGGFLSTDERSIAVLKDGRIRSVDAGSNVITEIATVKLPPGKWVHSAVNSADSNKIFVSLSLPDGSAQGQWSGGEILSVNLSDSAQSAPVKTKHPFNYLFLSRNGRQLYAINSSEANLMVIDAATLKEVRTVEDIGESPAIIIEAP
jgi:YVTN family beta-propeller protein